MKLFKLILNCVLPVILIISLVLNVLLLMGFKITKEGTREDTTVPEQTEVVETDCVKPNHKKDKNKRPEPETEKTEETEETVVEEVTTPEPTVPEETTYQIIYEDTNIRVKYICFDYTRPNPTYFFEIENLSSKPLNVLFTDVCVNGKIVYVSGLTCEKLRPETSLIDEFVLSTKDNIDYNPSIEISFRIKVTDSNSYLDLYTTESIYL